MNVNERILTQPQWEHQENMICPNCKQNMVVHQGSLFACANNRCNYSQDMEEKVQGNYSQDMEEKVQAGTGVVAIIATAATLLLLLL